MQIKFPRDIPDGPDWTFSPPTRQRHSDADEASAAEDEPTAEPTPSTDDAPAGSSGGGAAAAPPPAPAPAPAPADSPPIAPAGASASDERPGNPVGDAVNYSIKALAEWTPTEALASYVAIYALIEPSSPTGARVIYLIGAALTVFLTWAQYRLDVASAAAELTPASSNTVWGRGVIYLVAFTVYVSALPGNMMFAYDWFELTYGGVAAIVAVVVIPQLAEIFKIPPPGEAA